MNKEIYPIGTVVELTNNPKVLMMIIGYRPLSELGIQKDFVAVAYPVGCIDQKRFFAFNYDDIQKVVFEGYSNLTFELFKSHFIQLEETGQLSLDGSEVE